MSPCCLARGCSGCSRGITPWIIKLLRKNLSSSRPVLLEESLVVSPLVQIVWQRLQYLDISRNSVGRVGLRYDRAEKEIWPAEGLRSTCNAQQWGTLRGLGDAQGRDLSVRV